MSWIVFSYSLSSKTSSSPRVTLWRRLQRLGAITPKAGVYVLPATEECVEAFQWLAQEVQQAKGEAVVMRVERFEGMTDHQLAELFQEACREKYGEIEVQAAGIEKISRTKNNPDNHAEVLEKLQRLQKRFSEVARVDFFDSPEGTRVGAQLRRIQDAFLKGAPPAPDIPHAFPAKYRKTRWVTRPRPHVDRLACAWLIRHFINPTAVIRYSGQPNSGEVAFDMRDAEFGHRGNLCTFETMIAAFRLKEPGLVPIAELVHEIDLRDGRSVRPETPGIDLVLKGWLLTGLSDGELETRGIALFEGLYTSFTRRPPRPSPR
jgi:hypothetical protein